MISARLPYRRASLAAVASGAPALEVRGLRVRYPGSGEVALQDVTWRVPAGTRQALLGPNGAGKSTLFKAIMGLLPIAAGEVRVCGQPAGAGLPLVAYLPQRAQVDWRFPMSVRKLVLSGRYIHLGWLRRPSRQDRQIAETVLERLGLADLAERQIGELSGGQQQRALLARTLAQEAELLLLDEPLNAVDARTREIVDEVLDDLQAQGRTIILSTHDLGLMDDCFDGMLYLSEGRAVPPPLGLIHHPHRHPEQLGSTPESAWTG